MIKGRIMLSGKVMSRKYEFSSLFLAWITNYLLFVLLSPLDFVPPLSCLVVLFLRK